MTEGNYAELPPPSYEMVETSGGKDAGTVVKRVPRRRHVCKPPGWRTRRRLDLGYGSEWRCVCGQLWCWSLSSWGESLWWEAEPDNGPQATPAAGRRRK